LKFKYWKVEYVENENPESVLKLASNRKAELVLVIKNPLSPKKSRVLLVSEKLTLAERVLVGKYVLYS
jgi:hypothetical protein